MFCWFSLESGEDYGCAGAVEIDGRIVEHKSFIRRIFSRAIVEESTGRLSGSMYDR